MRRGPASKLPLVTITDHWIQKRPAAMKPDAPAAPHALLPWSQFIGEPVADAGAAARGYADAGLMDEAVKRAVSAVATLPSAPLYDLLASAYLAKHRVPDAGRAFQAALRIDPDDETALIGYARVMLDAHRAEEATHAFERMLAIDPENIAALETWGVYLARTGDQTHALDLFRRAAATGRASGIAYVGLAAAPGSAEKMMWLERAFRAEPHDVWVVDHLNPEQRNRLGYLTNTPSSAWLPRK